MPHQSRFGHPAGRPRRAWTRRRLLFTGLSVPPLLLLATSGVQAVAASAASLLAKVEDFDPTTPPLPAASGGVCVLTPEQTEGPYYIDVDLIRSDISEGKPGVPLQLELTVQDATTCQPVQGALVEIWHCDAGGVYSGYDATTLQGPAPALVAPTPGVSGADAPPPGSGPPPDGAGAQFGGHPEPTNGLHFLRGGQVADAAGRVRFQTMYPGWYSGRTVHIHVKVHAGGLEVHTGQLYMDDEISDSVFAQPPYADHPGRDTTNATDAIFRHGGEQSMLPLSPTGVGYVGIVTLGVQI